MNEYRILIFMLMYSYLMAAKLFSDCVKIKDEDNIENYLYAIYLFYGINLNNMLVVR